MTNKKSTKRALLMSVLSVLMCVAMLASTTFAWFTDSVTSTNNIIQSGNLDIELYYQNDTTTDWVKVDANTNVFKADALWEPGHTEVIRFKIANEGSLALNYQFGVNVVSEVRSVNQAGQPFQLSDYIYFGVVDGEMDYADRAAAVAAVKNGAAPINTGYSAPGNLIAGTDSAAYVTMVVYMPETVGNDANRAKDAAVPTINLGINLLATQATYEHDSFGNDYDSMASGKLNATYHFDTPADLLAFAPTAGDAASSGLSLVDGKAQIDKEGAWYTVDADLSANEYVVEYDLDITNLTTGENVTVDTGESTNWGSTPIVLERGSTKVYYGLSKNEAIGTLEGTVVHVTHVYKYNSESKLEITTTVSDGTASVQYTKAVASAAQTTLYWDIYDTAAESGKATMDNFSVKGGDAVVDSAEELNVVLAKGGKVVLTDDMTVNTALEIPKGVTVTLDLNGKTLTGTMHKNDGDVIKNNGELTLVGGTVSSTAANGGSAIRNNGTLTVEGTALNGASNADGGWPSYTVNNAGVMTVNNAKITSTHGAVASYGEGAIVTLNNSEIDMAGIPGFTSHGFYTYENGKVVVNGGTYTNKATDQASTGGSVINGYVEVNGGTFTGRIENYYGTPVINGGTFSVAPTGYVADGFTAVDNENGTWTVLPKIENVELKPDAESGLYWNGNNKNHQSVYYAFTASDFEKVTDYFVMQGHSSESNKVTIDLMTDVDLSGETWDGWNVMFITLNGNGHTISNLTANGGLFGYAGAVTINDLTLENVTSSGNQAGTFAASAEGTTFNNCYLKGNNTVTYVDADKNENGVGAITGVTIDSNLNVTITEGTTVTVNMNDIADTEKTFYVDMLIGYKFKNLNTGNFYPINSGTITNKGTIIRGISTADELVALGGTNINGTYALTADLDMTGKDMKSMVVPGGAKVNFIGNGHTISNLNLGAANNFGMTDESEVAGLFDLSDPSVTVSLTVSDLTIKDATVECSKYAAAIVGYTSNDSVITLKNVDVDGATVKAETVAALVGYTIKVVNLTDCDVSNLTLTGETPEKVGAYVGTANTATCIVTTTDCTNNTTYNDYGRVINGARTTVITTETLTDGAVLSHVDNDSSVVLSSVANVTATEYTVPAGVTALASGVFSGNTGITKVTIPANVIDFGATGVSDTNASSGAFKNSSVTTIVLEEGMSEIPAAAFNGATNLTSVNIPASVTTIGVNAFRSTALTELTVPDTVTTISYGAFRDMDSLTTVTIEGNNANIPNYAFRDCSALRTVYLNGENVTVGTNMAFANASSNNPNTNNITFYVKNSTVADQVKTSVGVGSYVAIYVNGTLYAEIK